jgi:hypothetical protein
MYCVLLVQFSVSLFHTSKDNVDEHLTTDFFLELQGHAIKVLRYIHQNSRESSHKTLAVVFLEVYMRLPE